MKTGTPKKLLSETAYQSILDALFSKQLPFGSRMSQKDLERITGTAVGPIRDALKVLEADGIVKVHPRSGIEVVTPSAELVRSTFQFRTIIERAAVKQFSQHARSQDILDLKNIHLEEINRLKGCDPSSDQTLLVDKIEDQFHTGIVNSLQNELIDISFRRLHLMVRVIKTTSFLSPSTVITSLEEHLKVLDACEMRDSDLAENLIGEHLMNALSRNLGLK
ncbi:MULTISPECIES: GntR family transcriptional regulator [Halocynthiibacter]|uniref:GntR family transcriptional regulator n=1 Tax=Halocynthiibacter halioticoli TaxID=2986804 RepID=A0AAE3IZC1_9RHOB|nr:MULTISPECIES: GntR family transcriptional regulator [Halocynthiibacter]MCV6825112.1 GntR family transcriptional regulator [Halocynthiibacter halioticoli]MCW4058113.1 GntR family transcriptional regulator [Halocynthiibacter sp. SDUM655004]